MPKITKGGVSNKLVDPDFIAEPGTPVEVAVDEGRPNVGLESEEQPETHQGRALYATDDETTDNEQDKPIDGEAPRTQGKDVKNVDSTEGPDVKRAEPKEDGRLSGRTDAKQDGKQAAEAKPAVGAKPRKANLPK